MSIQEDLQQIALKTLYMKPEVVEFLLIENLALKTLLHEKGLFTPEEFKECQEKAKARVQSQMEEVVKGQLSQISQP
jgi:hypothetical protein